MTTEDVCDRQEQTDGGRAPAAPLVVMAGIPVPGEYRRVRA